MRILWLKTELLHPVDKGGRIRTYNMLRELKREHHVTYLTLDDGTAAPDAMERATEYCHEVERVPFTTTPKDSRKLYVDLLQNLVSPLPYAVAKYRSPAMRSRITEMARAGRFDVIVCDFLFPSQNVPGGLAVPTVLFQHNVEAAIWERHHQNSASAIRKYYMREQWRRMARFERAECRRFDAVIAVSEADAITMERDYGLPHVAWVPTGVDTRYFAPSGLARVNPHEIVFTGAMDWLPNEDAITHFTSSILPLVRRSVPDAKFTVVGRNPTARIRQLAASTANMQVAGSVPDVRPYVEQGAVSIVPMRIGGGTRLKIYEAMSLAKPVVTTTVGAEGLPVTPGEHALFADDAEGFAAAVVRLLQDPAEARALGERGAEFVRRNFGWERVSQQFAEICAEVVQREAGDARRMSA